MARELPSAPKRRPSACPATAAEASRWPTSRAGSSCSISIPGPTRPAAPRRRSTFPASRPPSPKPIPQILGVSADPVPAQDKFKAKHKLTVALGSDESHRMLEAYGVWQEKSMYGRKFMGIVRTTIPDRPRPAHRADLAESFGRRPRGRGAGRRQSALTGVSADALNCRSIYRSWQNVRAISGKLTIRRSNRSPGRPNLESGLCGSVNVGVRGRPRRGTRAAVQSPCRAAPAARWPRGRQAPAIPSRTPDGRSGSGRWRSGSLSALS